VSQQRHHSTPAVIAAIGRAVLGHLPQRTLGIGALPKVLRRDPHHAIASDPEAVTGIFEPPDGAGRTAADVLRESKT
jgi:hypothetical protein